MIQHKQVTTKIDTATLTLAEMGVIIANKATVLTLSVSAAGGFKGLWYHIINIGAGTCVVNETAGGTLVTLLQNSSVTLHCDGTAWRVSQGISNHLSLSNIGTLTHAQLETAIALNDQTLVVETLTISAADITAKYKDLAHVPLSVTAVDIFPIGGVRQKYIDDFTVITNGADILRLNWSTLGLESLLAANDIIVVSYIYIN